MSFAVILRGSSDCSISGMGNPVCIKLRDMSSQRNTRSVEVIYIRILITILCTKLRTGRTRHTLALVCTVSRRALEDLFVDRRLTTSGLPSVYSGACATKSRVVTYALAPWLTFALTIEFIFDCCQVFLRQYVICLLPYNIRGVQVSRRLFVKIACAGFLIF